jgi:hypothetical protein
MSVHMQDRGRVTVCNLKDLAESAAADAGPDAMILDVILVSYGMPGIIPHDTLSAVGPCGGGLPKASRSNRHQT